MKTFVLILLSFSFYLPQSFANNFKAAVILVPGVWNSGLPGNTHFNPVSGIIEANPYFSEQIIQSIESQGYATYVIKDLSWFGQLENNGERTYWELRNWYDRYFSNSNLPIYLLGHSSGGFYSLYAEHLNQSSNDPLPIKKIIMLSTPLKGTGLAETFFEKYWFSPVFSKIVSETSNFFDLRGLKGLTAKAVKNFLAPLQTPPTVDVYTLASSQPPPDEPIKMADMEYLSPFFWFTSQFVDGVSDGIVSLDSAYGVGETFSFKLKSLRRYQAQLDHAEQVLDYRIFKLLGTYNAELVRDRQAKLYSSIWPAVEGLESL